MDQQPKWKFLKNLGDASPLEYGGYLVYGDETGQYAEEAEYWAEPETEGGRVTVYRFALDRCTDVGGVLSDNAFHPECPAWFANAIAASAGSAGVAENVVRAMLCSADPLERASAYRTKRTR